MGNKKKGPLPGAEGFQRINFLYQASHAILQNCPEHSRISAIYGAHMTSIGKKLQLKMLDPSVKRTLCKTCKGLLIPGQTATVRLERGAKAPVKNKRSKRAKKPVEKFQLWTCLICGAKRRFKIDPKFLLWSEQPQSAITMQ